MSRLTYKSDMNFYNRYLFRTVLVGTLFVTAALAAVIFLTQSLRFLELVMSSGASSLSFWVLTLLAMPRFLEIILPIALAASIIFTYSRLTSDSELIVWRAAGASPLTQARPVFILTGLICALLWVSVFWLGPNAMTKMSRLEQVVKAEYSTLLLHEGNFNMIGDNIMVFVRDRLSSGELQGVIIQDSRKDSDYPVTIIADRGVLVADDGQQKVLIYDGARQSYDSDTGAFQRLDFERYTLDFPQSSPVGERWLDPNERTLSGLLNPDMNDERDRENMYAFRLELHRRLLSPVLTVTFALIGLASLLIGPVDRRGQTRKTFAAAVTIILIQGLYLAAFNIARTHPAGIMAMYALVLIPIGVLIFMLRPESEPLRRKWLYRSANGHKAGVSAS